MINEQIRDKEVRVISESGEQLGIMSAKEAMKLAQEAELEKQLEEETLRAEEIDELEEQLETIIKENKDE